MDSSCAAAGGDQPGRRHRELHEKPLRADRKKTPGVTDGPVEVVGQVGVLLDRDERVERLDQPQAVPGIQHERDLQGQLAGLDPSPGPAADQRGRPLDQGIVLALLHLLVQQRVVGGDRGELPGPQLADRLDVAAVQPQLAAPRGPQRGPDRLVPKPPGQLIEVRSEILQHQFSQRLSQRIENFVSHGCGPPGCLIIGPADGTIKWRAKVQCSMINVQIKTNFQCSTV